jgi:7,8-dihydro-6-hydroxymethylpterin-pyrophosphokinase
MHRHHALVALGSNLGDRAGYLRMALARLGAAVKRS